MTDRSYVTRVGVLRRSQEGLATCGRSGPRVMRLQPSRGIWDGGQEPAGWAGRKPRWRPIGWNTYVKSDSVLRRSGCLTDAGMYVRNPTRCIIWLVPSCGAGRSLTPLDGRRPGTLIRVGGQRVSLPRQKLGRQLIAEKGPVRVDARQAAISLEHNRLRPRTPPAGHRGARLNPSGILPVCARGSSYSVLCYAGALHRVCTNMYVRTVKHCKAQVGAIVREERELQGRLPPSSYRGNLSLDIHEYSCSTLSASRMTRIYASVRHR